ncbi:MAG: efflux RND transporter periplasmic adaptor subunit [bacterium]
MKELIDHHNKGAKPRASKKRKKITIILVMTVIVGLISGGTLIVSNHSGEPLLTTAVKRGNITIKITEAGELRAQDQVTVSAINDKQIIWMAPEGEWVEEGDTLIILASEKYVISSGEAQSSLLVAKADLSRAISDLHAQQAKEEGARKNYESLPELAKKGFVMESEVEQARLAYMELKSKTMAFRASVDAARANVERAARGFAQERRKLREGVYLAPRAGLVVYATMGDADNPKKISLGMTPFEGMDLMYLPDISSMMVDAEISEVDLSRVKAGLPVEIRLDAYPDAVFKGEIKSISDLARRKVSQITGKATGAKVFDVTIKVLEHDVRLKPGLTANVDIIVNQHDDALFIPLETIFLDEQDQALVYVKNHNGKIESRPIVLGESNDRVAIVKEGLHDYERICLSRPALEQLTQEESVTSWFTRITQYFKFAPTDSSAIPKLVKAGSDFQLTPSDSLSADSVASALNLNFALFDSLTADSVKSKNKVSSLR